MNSNQFKSAFAATSVLVALSINLPTAAANEAPEPTQSVSTLTRAQVAEQLATALSEKSIALIGEATFVAATAPTQTSRQQIRAEAMKASELGMVNVGEASKPYTPLQLEQIRAAGQRAVATIISTK